MIDVWQALVENAKTVELSTGRFAVRRTPKRDLRQADFVFDGNEIRGLEQNPQSRSPWAEVARSGQKVMQFLSKGRYVANVAGGKVTIYRRRARCKPSPPDFPETVPRAYAPLLNARFIPARVHDSLRRVTRLLLVCGVPCAGPFAAVLRGLADPSAKASS
jgi:hypothetical protein